MWLKLIFVALGGAFGALVRFGVSTWTLARWGTGFPWGTLIVNLVGCLLIGLASVIVGALPHNDQLKPLIITGFLGALTTFSTFGLESWHHLEEGRLWMAAINVVGSCIAGLGLVYLGLRIGRYLTSFNG